MSKYKIQFAGVQAIGERESQQDRYAFHVTSEGNAVTCIVADGMGGHAAGEVAAELAVLTFLDELEGGNDPDIELFPFHLDKANRAIRRNASEHPERHGMGTTLVALQVLNNSYAWLSIGDSLLFLIRNGAVRRMNETHSLAAQLDAAAERGEISYEEARTSQSRNVLTSALTGAPLKRYDHARNFTELEDGDWLVVATDGIETLNIEEIGATVRETAPQGAQQVATSLVQTVLRQNVSGQDNVTVCVLALDITASDDDMVTTRPILVS